jgi:hypothetical protein
MPTPHQLSAADHEFLGGFEEGTLSPQEFHHREHVRLAYMYLALHGPDGATAKLREALQGYLSQHGIDPAKYHETMTHAWLLAVHHFMVTSPPRTSSDEFIVAQPILLDPRIMLTHYSSKAIKSEEARASFVEPDLDPIPRHSQAWQ